MIIIVDSYTPLDRYNVQAVGSNPNTWGLEVNSIWALIEQNTDGYQTINFGTSVPGSSITATVNNGSTDQARTQISVFTGTPTSACTYILPNLSWTRTFSNQCGQPVTVTTATSVDAYTIQNGINTILWCDGTNVFLATDIQSNTFQNITITGNPSSGGTGYHIGDLLTILGGNGTAATFTVATLTGSSIATVTQTTPGNYTLLPSNPVQVTGGFGTGATLNVTFGSITSIAVDNGGDYSAFPTNPVSTVGAGSGATFNLSTTGTAVTGAVIVGVGSGYSYGNVLTVVGGISTSAATLLVNGIGAISATVGINTSLSVTGNTVLDGQVLIEGTLVANQLTNTPIINSLVDNTPIGSITPSSGIFTSAIIGTGDFNGGAINNTSIGFTTPSTGNFTAASQSINGNVYNYSPFAFRNRLVNPFMNIDQRKEGASLTLVTGTSVFSGDQWQTQYVDPNITAPHVQALVANSPTAFPSGKSLQFTNAATGHAATATTLLRTYQNIEGYNATDLAFGTSAALPVVLSFWVMTSIAGFVGSVALTNTGNTRSYIQNYTITSANTWTQILLAFPGDTAGSWTNFESNSAALSVMFCFACGVGAQTATPNVWTTQTGSYGTSTNTDLLATGSATYNLTAVQLEVGNEATQIERRPFQQYLADCQRYCEKSYVIGTAPGTVTVIGQTTAFLSGANFASQIFQAGNTVRFATAKRAIPAITLYNPATGTTAQARDIANGANLTGVAVGSTGEGSFFWDALTTTGNTEYDITIQWVADAGI